MNNIKIKLSSNYQQIEFDITDLNEDLTPAIDLINLLGKRVLNSANGGKVEEMATASQVELLKKYHIKDAEKYTRSDAWKKIRELTK